MKDDNLIKKAEGGGQGAANVEQLGTHVHDLLELSFSTEVMSKKMQNNTILIAIDDAHLVRLPRLLFSFLISIAEVDPIMTSFSPPPCSIAKRRWTLAHGMFSS